MHHPKFEVSGFFSVRLLMGMIVLLVVLGCGQDDGASSQNIDSRNVESMEPQPGGMAVIAISGDPDGLNPLIRRSSVSGMVIAEILDTLAELETGMIYYPRIAESWNLAPDSLSITYHLRPWIWEDGDSLTADDVAASFNLFKDPRVASHRRGFFRSVESVEVVDKATIRYHFSDILPDPLSRTQHAILPLHIVSELDPADVGSWPLNQFPVSSGPFRMISWDHSREIVLQRNENYPLASPMLDRVSFRIMKEPATRILGLETGEIDFVTDVSSHDAKRLQERDDLQVMVTEARRYYYLMWNCKNPRFKDATTRRALSMAIDRERMTQTLLDGFSDLAVGPVARVAWNFHRKLNADPYDPAVASAMLASAGWKDDDGDGLLERNGLPLEFEILTRQSDPVRSNGVVIIRENLKAVGARVSVRTMELASELALIRAGDFDSYLGAMNPNLFGDPSSAVHSSAIDEFNNGFYSNAVVDSLLAAALGQQDRSLARPIWFKLQEILQEDPPAAYLFCPQRLDVVSKRIRNVRPDVLSPFNNLTQWWISPADRKYQTGTNSP
jgi:peptide/nickel transport system substrate-binding protein